MAVAAWSASFPGTPLLATIVGGCLVSGVFVAGLAGGVAAGPGHRRRWLTIAALTPTIALVIGCAGTPLTARWAVSRAAFQRALPDAEASCGDEGGSGSARRLGAYGIGAICRHEGAVLFYEVHGDADGVAGFSWAPEGIPESLPGAAPSGPFHFRSLGGPWYSFRAGY